MILYHTNSAEIAEAAITQLLSIVHICDTSAQDITAARMFKMNDFEDAVLAATAQRENADYIVT